MGNKLKFHAKLVNKNIIQLKIKQIKWIITYKNANKKEIFSVGMNKMS